MKRRSRTIIGRFNRATNRQQRIKRLPTHLVVAYDSARDIDEDTRLVMMALRSRDVMHVRLLETEYGKTGIELLKALPKPQRKPLSERVLDFLRRLEGSLPYEPSGYRRSARSIEQQNIRIPIRVKLEES